MIVGASVVTGVLAGHSRTTTIAGSTTQKRIKELCTVIRRYGIIDLSKGNMMDNPYNNCCNQDTGPEGKATMISAADMIKAGTLVMDRVTGEMYDPQAKFDELMQKDEIVAVLKRLKVR